MTGFNPYYTTGTPYPTPTYATQWWATYRHKQEMNQGSPPPYSQVVDYGQGWQTHQPNNYAHPSYPYNQGPVQQPPYNVVLQATYPFSALAPYQSPMQSFPPPYPVTVVSGPYPPLTMQPVPSKHQAPDSEICHTVNESSQIDFSNVDRTVESKATSQHTASDLDIWFPRPFKREKYINNYKGVSLQDPLDELRNEWHELVKESLSENTAQSFLDGLIEAQNDTHRLRSMLDHFIGHKHPLSDESIEILTSIILASSRYLESIILAFPEQNKKKSHLDIVKSILGIAKQTPGQATFVTPDPAPAPPPPAAVVTAQAPVQAAAQAPAPASAQAVASQPPALAQALAQDSQSAITIASVPAPAQASPPQPPAAAATAQAQASPPQPPAAAATAQAQASATPVLSAAAAAAAAAAAQPPAQAPADPPPAQTPPENLALFASKEKDVDLDVSKSFFVFYYDDIKFNEFKNLIKNYSKSDIEKIIDNGRYKGVDEFKAKLLSINPSSSTQTKSDDFYKRAYGFYAISCLTNFITGYTGHDLAEEMGNHMQKEFGNFSLHTKHNDQRFLYFTDKTKVSESLKDVHDEDELCKTVESHITHDTSSNNITNGYKGKPLLVVGRMDDENERYGLARFSKEYNTTILGTPITRQSEKVKDLKPKKYSKEPTNDNEAGKFKIVEYGCSSEFIHRKDYIFDTKFVQMEGSIDMNSSRSTESAVAPGSVPFAASVASDLRPLSWKC